MTTDALPHTVLPAGMPGTIDRRYETDHTLSCWEQDAHEPHWWTTITRTTHRCGGLKPAPVQIWYPDGPGIAVAPHAIRVNDEPVAFIGGGDENPEIWLADAAVIEWTGPDSGIISHEGDADVVGALRFHFYANSLVVSWSDDRWRAQWELFRELDELPRGTKVSVYREHVLEKPPLARF